MSSATNTTGMGAKSNPMDAKREEFYKYLEKEGIIESLTKALVQLYEEPEKPKKALEYMQRSFGDRSAIEKELAAEKEKNDILQRKIDELSFKISELTKENEELKKEAEFKATVPEAPADDNQAEANDEEQAIEDAGEDEELKEAEAKPAEPVAAAEDDKQTEANNQEQATVDASSKSVEEEETAMQTDEPSESAGNP